MSQENVEAVRRIFGGDVLDGLEPGGMDAVIDQLPPDFEWIEDPRFPEAGSYRGREAVRRYFRQFTDEFDEYTFFVEDLVAAGPDQVLIKLRIQGRGKGSGAVFDIRPGWLAEVRGDQVIRVTGFFDRREALEAAGLSE